MTAGKSVAARLRPVFPLLLVLMGLGLLTAAAWCIALPAGLAVGGLSCFALQWYLVDGMHP